MSRPCALTGWYNGKRAATNDMWRPGGITNRRQTVFVFGSFSTLDRKLLVENDA
jgi:hypothetical protein